MFWFPLLASLFLPLNLLAHEPGVVVPALRLEPAKVEIRITPGGVSYQALTVTNQLGHEVNVEISVEDFEASSQSDEVIHLQGLQEGAYTLKDFIGVSPTQFVLQDDQSQAVEVAVKIPTDVGGGGRFAGVVVKVTSPGDDEANIKTVNRLVSLFFVRVEGQVEESGFLKDFNLKAGSLFASKRLFEVTYTNQGNVHLNPYGHIVIENIFGKNVGEIIVDPWFVLPNSTRTRKIEWYDSSLFGFYKAHLSLNRGYEDIIDERVLSFWALSVQSLLSFISVAVLIILVWATYVATKRKYL